MSLSTEEASGYSSLLRYEVLGVPCHPLTRASTQKLLDEALKADVLRFVVTLGTEMVMAAQTDDAFLDVVRRADLIVPDGIGLVLAARLAGLHAPERVAGVDLVADLVKLAQGKVGFYFYGAAPGVAELAVARLKDDVGPLECVGVTHGFVSPDEVIEVICQAKPKVLLVALGFPRQEKFLDAYRSRLSEAGVRVVMGVGGSFDAYAGTVERAPVWVQHLCLEWLYRLCRQPSRWRRMLALPRFAMRVLRAPKQAVKVLA